MAKQLCYADPEKLTDMANSLRQKLGTTDQYTISEMAEAVKNVNFGIDTSGATAIPSDLLYGKIAYANDEEIVGTIPSKAATSYTAKTTDQVISAGQYLEGDQVIIGDSNLIPDNIKNGISIFGVSGNFPSGGNIDISENGSYDVTNYSSAQVLIEPHIYTTSAMPAGNSTSILFSGLEKEPKMFAVILTTSQITNGSTRTVINVTYDGTNTYASQAYENNTKQAGYIYHSTSFTWSYSSGTLTITSPSGTTNSGGYFISGYAYMLICVY